MLAAVIQQRVLCDSSISTGGGVVSLTEKRVMLFRSYSLPVRDRAGRKWEFVIKSWANGTENRRVYVLEQTGEYLKVLLSGIMQPGVQGC